MRLPSLFYPSMQSPVIVQADPFIVHGSNIRAGYGTDNSLMTRSALLETGVSPLAYGAKGDGISDDTVAIQKMLSSGNKSFNFGNSRYKINILEGSTMHKFSNLSGIRILGSGAVLYDTRTYVKGDFTSIFSFDNCTDVVVNGVNYEGTKLDNPENKLGYFGATFVNISNNSSNINVAAELKYLRYGVRSGSYILPSEGYCKKINVKLVTLQCGYPIAFYLAEDINAEIYADTTHRAAYLAGIKGGKVTARFKNQYIGDTQVLITDAKTGVGTSRGSSGLDVFAMDIGSTRFMPNSWCVGISLSRVDPGTTFSDINMYFHVVSTDTIASTLGGAIINSTARIPQPSYPFNWEQFIHLDNIKIKGVIDRSAQTITEHRYGEIYMYTTTDNAPHYATVENLDVSEVLYKPGSGSKPSGFIFNNPGLVGNSRITNCDFGTTTPFRYISNTNSLTTFNRVKLRSTHDSKTSNSSRIILVDSEVINSALQPTGNVTFVNTSVGGVPLKNK